MADETTRPTDEDVEAHGYEPEGTEPAGTRAVGCCCGRDGAGRDGALGERRRLRAPRARDDGHRDHGRRSDGRRSPPRPAPSPQAPSPQASRAPSAAPTGTSARARCTVARAFRCPQKSDSRVGIALREKIAVCADPESASAEFRIAEIPEDAAASRPLSYLRATYECPDRRCGDCHPLAASALRAAAERRGESAEQPEAGLAPVVLERVHRGCELRDDREVAVVLQGAAPPGAPSGAGRPRSRPDSRRARAGPSPGG